jgi:hypothetical protein
METEPTAAPAPSVVESTPLADAPPAAAPIPADHDDAPVDMDLPPGHPDQPKPTAASWIIWWSPSHKRHRALMPGMSKLGSAACPSKPRPSCWQLSSEGSGKFTRRYAKHRQRNRRLTSRLQLTRPPCFRRKPSANKLAKWCKAYLDSQWGDLAKVNPEHWQQLAEQHPERASDIARLQGFLNTFRAQNQAAKQVYEQNVRTAEQQRAEAFQEYKAEQDRTFRERNPHVTPEVQQHAMTYLESDLGLSKQQIRHLWDNEPIVRSAVFQQVLLDATQWRMAQTRAKTIAPTYHRPQMPGVSAPYGTPNKSSLQSAADRGDMAAYIRARNGKGT